MEARMAIINNVISSMHEVLSKEQIEKLKTAMIIHMNDYEVQERETALTMRDNSADSLLMRFIATKRIEGKAESTLRRYRDLCYMMLHTIGKPIYEISTYDLRYYLAMYQERRKVSNRTLDGMRRCFSSFFRWLSGEGAIGRDPCISLNQIKYTKTVKKPFTPKEMERLKQQCTDPDKRDRALLEFLYATGCRVSEVVALNRGDIDFVSREAVVIGKGNKERIVYLTEVAAMHLQDYLNMRSDSSQALFVSRKSPHERLSKAGIETVLKCLGKKAKVENVHPHRYRRTFATHLLDAGAKIQDVAAMMGHEDIKTTMIYCCMTQSNIRRAYNRYM